MSSSANSKTQMEPIENLDRVIHEPARLKIMTQLYVVESGDFTYLMRVTSLTRGNLSSHMTKLEEVGYIEVKKEFVDRKPLTMLRLTPNGREALENYRETMAQVIADQPPD